MKNNIKSENNNTRFNSLSIGCEDTLQLDMYVTHEHDNESNFQIQIYDKVYQDILYDEMLSENARNIRDFMNKAYPLSFREVVGVAVVSLKSMVALRGL